MRGRPQARPSGGSGNADRLNLGQRRTPPPAPRPLARWAGPGPVAGVGGRGGAVAWGKVTGWTIRFLALPEPRVLAPAAPANDPPPLRHTAPLRLQAPIRPPPFPSQLIHPPPPRERGWVTRKNFSYLARVPHRRRRTCPYRSGGSLRCGAEPLPATIQMGGGAPLSIPSFPLPSSHPTPSKRATCPGQSEARRAGGECAGVGGQRGQRVVPGHVPAQAPRPCWCLERGRVLCPPPRTTPMYQRAAETW